MRLFTLAVLLAVQSLGRAQERVVKPPTPQQIEAAKDSQIVLIMDHFHSVHLLDDYFSQLQTIRAADPKFECLFLELEPSGGKAISRFLAGADYVETVGLWISQTSHRVGVPIVNFIAEKYLLRVRDLGYRFFGVDVDFESEFGKRIIPLIKKYHESESSPEIDKLMVGERSRIMAENSIEKLTNGSCAKGVLIAGAGHFEPIAAKPIQFYLKNANIPGVFWN